VLVSVVEVGFVFSGNVGTGILLKKNADDTWSAPVACGMSGVGWGLLVGGSVKDIMIFIFDEATLAKIGFDKIGLKFGAQVRMNFLQTSVSTVQVLGLTYIHLTTIVCDFFQINDAGRSNNRSDGSSPQVRPFSF